MSDLITGLLTLVVGFAFGGWMTHNTSKRPYDIPYDKEGPPA